MKRTNRIFGIVTMVLIAAFLLPACSNDEGNPTQSRPGDSATAPELPPVSSMTFDLDFFGVQPPDANEQSIAAGKPGPELQTAAAATRTNFINGFIRALYLQLLMFDALQEPVAAFALAIHSVPQKQEDGSWLWTYIFVDQKDGAEYSVFLYGTNLVDRVAWRLEVSTNNPDLPLDHFKWFDGETIIGEDSGYWQFYEPVETPPAVAARASATTGGVQTIRIDFENPSNTDHILTVTNNGPGHEEEGDYLVFHETATTGTIDFYDISEDLLSNITWRADGSGSITVPDYNNGEKACWDTNQENIDCPQ